jgi:hypothetical protein
VATFQTSRRATPPPAPDPLSSDVRLVAPADLRRACELLREDVASLTLPLDVPGVETGRLELAALLTQLDDYLLPRLRRIDAPLLAVVGGSTGAGKSTLVNSLIRRFVTRSGVLRPTTRSPVLIHHPYDSGAFLTQRILPGFARVTSEAPEPVQPVDVHAPRVTALRLVPDEGLAPGLAIIDAPDIDSLVETNRDLAVQLLSAADLWIFVTTAARYSDAVPWDMLRTAVDRGVSVAVVLDRVPPEAMGEVRVHLATMLRDRGLSTAPLFTIPESVKDLDGFLPEEAVAPLHGWLSRLARDSRSRDVVVRRTLVGALDSLHERVKVLAVAAEEQVSAHAVLQSTMTEVFHATHRQVTGALVDGSLVRGEVLARWQEYVGTGEVFRGLDGTVGRLRDRLTAAVRGRPAPSAGLAEALRTGVRAAVSSGAQTAVQHLAQRWRQHSSGPRLLDQVDGAPALSFGFADRCAHAVQTWQEHVAELVRAEAAGRRPSARAAAFGVDGAAVIVMLLALDTEDRPAPEPAVAASGRSARSSAGGSVHVAGRTATAPTTPASASQVARRVLTAILGDVGPLVEAARADLLRRVEHLLTGELTRFERVLDTAGVRGDLAVALRTHVRAIERAR